MPLLIPPWCVAVIYQDSFGFGGTGALVLVLGVAAAPLFALLVGAALRNVPQRYGEMLRVLGRGGPLSTIILLGPLAVPALAGAAVLSFLIAWGDAGTAHILGVPTLTVGLLDQWFGREDAAAGALIAVALLALSVLPGSSSGPACRAAHGRMARTSRIGCEIVIPCRAGAGRFRGW